MGRSKNFFTLLREQNLWEIPSILKKLDEAEGFLSNLYDNEETTEEQFEVVKGKYKTVITYKFNKEGYPIAHTHKVEYQRSEKETKLQELESQLRRHVTDKNYKEAAKLQDEIEELNKTN